MKNMHIEIWHNKFIKIEHRKLKIKNESKSTNSNDEKTEYPLIVTSESLIWHRTTETDLLLLELASELVFPPPPILLLLSSPTPELLLETDLPRLTDDDVSDSELLELTRPRFAESKNSIARSSRLISGKPEPLTVLTNLPLGAGRSESESREERGRAGRLRLRERRWWREEEEARESSPEEAPTGILLVVDLKAAVAISWRVLGLRVI